MVDYFNHVNRKDRSKVKAGRPSKQDAEESGEEGDSELRMKAFCD